MAGESSCPAEAVRAAEASDSDGTEHSSAASRRFVDEPRDHHLLYHRRDYDLGIEVGDFGDYLYGNDDAVDQMLSPSRIYARGSYPYDDELGDPYNGELSHSYDDVGAGFELPHDYDRVIMEAEMQHQQRPHEPAEAAMQVLEGHLDELHLTPGQTVGESVLQRPSGLAAYGNGGFGATPPSADSVAALDKHKYDCGGGDEGRGAVESTGCVICIQEYEVGDDLSVMPCSYRHKFHQKCLAEWLACSRLCPLCRHALPTEE